MGSNPTLSASLLQLGEIIIPLNETHARLANAALYYFIILALWGYWRFFRKQGLSSGFWGSVVIGEILLLLQSGLGALLLLSGSSPGRGIHILYGVVSLLALPAVYLYTRGRQERAEMLMYSTTTLITFGLVLRAITTA